MSYQVATLCAYHYSSVNIVMAVMTKYLPDEL